MNNAKPWIFNASYNNGIAARAEYQSVPAVSLALIQLGGAGGPKCLYTPLSWQQATHLGHYLIEHGPQINSFEQAQAALQVELDTELNTTPDFATTISAANGIVFHDDTFLAADFTPYGTWAETVCGDLHQVRLEMIDSRAPAPFAICLFY
ncbi:hypothetical protein [Pseudomonas wenzhouensis]|uniref:hypothetical protein n=1 Tax=Pseudomonas wenzhouensis TaxID=2906062 RepID=UPI001E504853|nr:hypothetical protein [Pseudomonas wenzhouensis]UFQ97313.1 hypothetical protein J7655_18860 [Pseudomonas wenzhouensis]